MGRSSLGSSGGSYRDSRSDEKRGGEGANFGVVEAEEFLGRSAGDDATSFEKDDVRGQEECFAKIMSDEYDGFAEAADEAAEFALKLGPGDGIEGSKRLIHEKKGRIGGEGAGNADTLALAAGELAGAAMGKFARFEADEV
jgi:hypothetical protein